ncbi:MAG: hypothetical protein RJA44_1739 [Pseudomonadota bacterium]|jgi:Tfp pilus assembly protein PilN
MKRLPVIEFGAERPKPWWGIALLALALLLLAWQFRDLNEQRDRVESQKEGMARLFVPKASSAMASMTPQDRRRHAQIEVVASYLAAPWDTLLAVFESHGRSGVLLRRLEPDASTGIVRVVGEARNIAMMMDYVLALEADKRLSQVLLLNHDLLKDAEGAPVEFTLSASWRAVGRAAVEAQAVAQPGAEGERP